MIPNTTNTLSNAERVLDFLSDPDCPLDDVEDLPGFVAFLAHFIDLPLSASEAQMVAQALIESHESRPPTGVKLH
jgi:hypothetical protein